MTSRNAPCPCGSGKRYKDCHGAVTAVPVPTAVAAEGPADLVLRQAERVLALDPDDPEALFHLGNRERERGEHAPAIARYERALRRAPAHPGVLNNLGLALEALGETERAETCYRDILAREPQHPDALLNLASLLCNAERYSDAVTLHERAATVRQDLPPAVWAQRALAQERVRDFAGAETSLREATRLAPDDVRLHVNLATLYMHQRRHAEAEEPLQRALALDANHSYALSTLAHLRQQRCAWDGLHELHARIARLLDESDRKDRLFNPFPLLAMPTSPLQRQVAARNWARGFARAAPPSPPTTRAPGERLRIGFVSSDFRPHATTHLLLELWERIDRRRMETFAYAIAAPDPGPMGARIERAFEHFADVCGEPAGRIAQRIRTDRIGILFDLNGYTRLGREAIFALKPAPLQVNAFGYLGTLGADWYDYVLTDRFVSPPQAQPYFDERFLHLDDCYCPGATGRDVAPDAETRAAHGLPEAALVFCCFNSAYKLLPEVFAVWMRLLAATPRSVLWLTQTRTDSADNLRREATAAGVDPARLVFAPRVALPQHLARHVHADLFLDTTPYNAGATANDALFMGLPLLTCAGEAMSSRIAGSQLHAAGLPELVTTGLAEYEALALALAAQPEELRKFRARLAANRGTSRLFDMARYARGFESAMERIWADYAAGTPN